MTAQLTEGWIARGEENTKKVRIFYLRHGLKIETKGLRLTSKGRTCYSMIKREFGFKGNKEKVLKQLEEWIALNIKEPFLESL